MTQYGFGRQRFNQRRDWSSLDLTSIAAFENGGFDFNFHVVNG